MHPTRITALFRCIGISSHLNHRLIQEYRHASHPNHGVIQVYWKLTPPESPRVSGVMESHPT